MGAEEQEAQTCPRCNKGKLVVVGDEGRFLECGAYCGYRFDTHLSREVQAEPSEANAESKPEETSCSEYAGAGFYAEEIFRPDVGEPEFLVQDDATGRISFEKVLKVKGEHVLPLKYDEKERKCVWLPDGAEEYESLQALRKRIRAWALKEYDPMGNDETFELFLSHAILSWLPELQQASAERFHPIFRALGPSESGKKRFLTIARYIYRRPFYAQKSNRVPSIFRGVDKWSGETQTGSTLILEEADTKRGDYDSELLQFLNGRADGVPQPRFNTEKNEMDFIYSEGYSVLAMRFPTRDTGIETRSITQPAIPTDKPERYDLIAPPEWEEEGRSIRRQLLMFRLRNRAKRFEVPNNLLIEGVGPRVRTTLMLLHPLKEQDPTIVRDYEEIGKRLEAKLREGRAGSNEGLVLNQVYGCIDHDPEAAKIWNLEHDGSVPFLSVKRPREEGEDFDQLRQPLTAGYVAQQIGTRGFSARDVGEIWRGLGQTVKPNSRYSQTVGGSEEHTDTKTYRGVLLITDSRRLAQEFKRFVPNNSVALVALVADMCVRQATLEPGGGPHA